jgi:hypothetical protein
VLHVVRWSRQRDPHDHVCLAAACRLTTTNSNCSVANASITVVDADAVVKLDAWRMVVQ